MKRIFLCTLMCLGTLLQWHLSFAQTTVNIPLSKDAYLVSGSPSSNYGNSEVLVAGSEDVRIAMFRTALQVDLTSIPENAVISSAKLFLYKHTGYTTSGNEDFLLERFESSWSEASISYSNQPRTDGTTIKLLEKVNGLYSFDITSDVINMYNGTQVNYGWLLRAGNETVNYSEEYFYSKEYKSAPFRPYVEVVYSSPFIVADAVINHATDSTTNDGSISPDISGGSGNYTYSWIEGSSGSNLGSSASLNGLSSGWYGVHVTDDSTSEEIYMAFIVGAKDGEFTVDFNPGPNYTDDAMIYDLVRNGVDYGENNYGTYSLFRAENWTYGSWYDSRSLLKFRLWMDPTFNINKADLYLSGYDHYPLSRPNTSEFRKIIEPWEENEVTHYSRPTIGSTPLEVLSATPQGNENKVVDMRSFWDEWALSNTENYGVMFQLQLYNDQYTRMKYYSSDAADPTTHPWMKFELAIPVSASWNDSTELGEVQVDISSLSTTGPYHYMISRVPIADISETYSYMIDSIGMPVDSVQFFTGNSASNTHIFSSVVAGTHFVAVFDANGNRILDQTVDVYGDLTLESGSTGLESMKNTIRANSGGIGVGSVELYTVQGDDVGFVAKLDPLSASPQFIGFAGSTVQVDSYTDLEYGIYFDGTSVRTIQSGSLSAPLSVNFDVREVQFQVVDDVLTMKANQQLLVTKSLPTEYTYKLGVGIQDGASITMLNFNLLPFMHEIVTYRFRPNVIRHLNCGGDQTAIISFSVASSNNTSQFTYSVTHQETGLSAGSGSLFFNSSATPITSFTNGTPLLPGIYVVEYVYSGQTYTGEIDLGYEAFWEQRDPEYTEVPNTYSLLVSGHDELTFLGALSKNIIRHDQEGWVEFTTVLMNDDELSMFRPTTLNPNSSPYSMAILTEEFASFFKMSVFNNYYWSQLFSPSQGYSSYMSLNDNSRIRVKFTTSGGGSGNGEIFLYENGVFKEKVDRGNSATVARFTSILNGDGFRDVITSFPCPQPSLMYGHLKYSLDGFYHIMNEGQIRFVFDQEYDADDLKFNIYNQNDELVKTQADYPALATTYGDNYLEIDVSTNGYCIGRGFFYLEVINSKKEKLYMRFFNNYTSEFCTDYINANQSND